MSASTRSSPGTGGAPCVPAEVPDLDYRRKRLVLIVCCASMVVAAMDISIVNVALPTIHRELHASMSDLQWSIDAYTVVLASFLLLAGSTADRIGRRRIFQLGLVTFGVGSLLCGLAPSIGWLIAARALQALGGTMLNPVAMAIIATTFPEPPERARAIGVFGAMAGLSLGLGPIAGGLLVGSLGWRSIFWINVPVVVAVVCTWLFVPESRAARVRRFDPVGQVLVILALGGPVYAIIESRRSGWTSPLILTLIAVAVAALVALVAYEPRRADPLLELRLFRSVPFSSAIVIAFGAVGAFGAFLFLTTQYLQDVRGLSPSAAGLCLIPVALPIAVLAPLTGRMVAARGPRVPLVFSGAALAVGAAASLWLTPHTPLPVVLAVGLLFGASLGTNAPPVTNTAVSGMPRSMTGVATSLASVVRQAGTTLGVAISGTIVGSALSNGGAAFTEAERATWGLLLAAGLALALLGLLSTGGWAMGTAEHTAALFDQIDRGHPGVTTASTGRPSD